jgi:eukaryotic-like serine/threonine-protein kinase
MTDDQINLRELFERALAIAPEDRAGFLDRHCGDTNRAILLRMLEVDSGGGQLLDRPFDEVFDAIDEQVADAPSIGSSIGPFRLLERLGDGGSSIVFRAEREQAGVRQQVALKLLRRDLHSAEEQRRFRDERLALARLQHPGIARLIEGDITAEGLPFIALELVEGTSIIDHARNHRLDLRRRLLLFIEVCRAVDAAHRALIVHRDLKPANVMVTADGEVKLLDFGIAKLLAAEPDEQGIPEQRVALTPAYAAPEQFERGVITTATDVYALGVVLGELITGLRRNPGESGAPSSQLENTSPGEDRIESISVLLRKLRGDLDAIVLKATEIDPGSRYASAGALAEDIVRYLDGQPVQAHPSSRLYRARKFVGRHRGGVATTLLFLIAILTALGVAIWQANVARAEAQRATSVRDFLLRVFSAAEPAGPRLAPPSVVDVVRASIDEAQHSPNLYPAVRIELLESLGNVLRAQGDLEDSIRLLDSNYREAKTLLGAADPTTLSAGLGLARALVDAGKRPQARALFDQLLSEGMRADPDLKSRLLAASALLAVDRFERARAGDESIAATDLCREQACSEPTRINAMLARGYVLASFQQDEAAIPILEDALLAQRAIYGGPHIGIADNEQGLSRSYRRLGQLDRAETLARDSLAIVEASVPDPHVRRTDALDTLRQILIDERQFDEAEALGERIILMDKATLGPEHPGVATSENTLGFTYMMDGKFALATDHFRAALNLSESIPDNQRRSAIYRSNLGGSIGRNGDPGAGMRLIRTSIDALRALPEPDYDQICSALEKLGALQRYSGDAKAASAAYSEALAIYTEKLPEAPKAWRVISLVGLGRAQIELGQDSQAADTFSEALANDTVPDDRVSPERIEARAGLAGILHRRGDDAAARVLLDQAQRETKHANGRLSATLQAFVGSVSASIEGR